MELSTRRRHTDHRVRCSYRHDQNLPSTSSWPIPSGRRRRRRHRLRDSIYDHPACQSNVARCRCSAIISRHSVAKLTHARRLAFCCPGYCNQYSLFRTWCSLSYIQCSDAAFLAHSYTSLSNVFVNKRISTRSVLHRAQIYRFPAELLTRLQMDRATHGERLG